MTETLHVKTRAELAAVVPHLLGFAPEDSLVCVPTHSGGPTARVDLPRDPRSLVDAVDALADAYRRHQLECPSLALLAFTEHGPDAKIAAAALAAALARTQTIEMRLWIDNDTWTDLQTGETGTVDQATRDRIAAEIVGRGRAMPKASRQELTRALQGDGAALASLLPTEDARREHLTREDLADEGARVLHAIALFEHDGTPPADGPAARLVAALQHPQLRNLVVAEHTRANAESLSNLWRGLTQRTPRSHVAPVAELLAFSAWLAGNGAEAWVAIDLIDKPADHPVAGLVATALELAAPPRIWDQARAGRNHRARPDPLDYTPPSSP